MCVWQRIKHRCGHYVWPAIDSLYETCEVANQGGICGITSYTAGDRTIASDCPSCKR
jgi:hypothetical protein